MAKQASKKSSSAGRNPDRKNGKAWKKAKPPKSPKTPERITQDMKVLSARESRRAFREEERARQKAIAILEEQRKADQAAFEAENVLRQDPVGAMVRTKKKQKVAA